MSVLGALNDIKVGLVINWEGEPYVVMTANFMRMQQRKPVMQTKLKHLITGKVLEYSFKPGDRVETADLQRTKVNYLYRDGEQLHFMDNNTFEQFSLSESVLGDQLGFLKDGMEVDVMYYNDKPINIELPKKVDLKVIETEPGVRGDTASGNVMKSAKLETGTTIQVPLFVKEGDVIRINTERGEYTERVTN
jgi:elongation factor P